MTIENECRKLLRIIVGKPEQSSHVCIVTAVNVDTGEDVATCDVRHVFDNKEIKKIRLNTTFKASDGFVIVPKIGSTVLVTNIESDKYFVSQFSEIEKITLNVDDSIEVNASNITINGGENGGLTITPELKTQLEKMTARIDGIIDAIKNAMPVAQDGGTSLQQSMVLALEMLTNKEDFSQIENTKITH